MKVIFVCRKSCTETVALAKAPMPIVCQDVHRTQAVPNPGFDEDYVDPNPDERS